MEKKSTGFFGLRMTPDEIASIQSRAKAEGMTRSAWAKRRLLSVETAGADAAPMQNLTAEIRRQHEQTRTLVLEKNHTLAAAVGQEIRKGLTTLGIEVNSVLLKVVEAINNAGAR